MITEDKLTLLYISTTEAYLTLDETNILKFTKTPTQYYEKL